MDLLALSGPLLCSLLSLFFSLSKSLCCTTRDSDSGENDLAIAGALGFASMLEEGSGSREGSEIGASPQQQTKPQAPSKPPPSRPPGVTELVFPGLNRIRASGTSASSATGSGSSTPSKKAVSEASTSVLDSSGSSSVSQKKVHRALADSKDFAAICSRESALKNLKLEGLLGFSHVPSSQHHVEGGIGVFSWLVVYKGC